MCPPFAVIGLMGAYQLLLVRLHLGVRLVVMVTEVLLQAVDSVEEVETRLRFKASVSLGVLLGGTESEVICKAGEAAREDDSQPHPPVVV